MKKHETLLKTSGRGWRKSAFTLAEVLVTLGIIGVVSAMTLPTLVKNHQRQVYVTQLQKVVNELSQAAEKAAQDNNAISLEETKYSVQNANGARDFLNDNFKVVQNCNTDLTPCFADSYKRLDGSVFTLENPITVVSLASGASISVFYQGYMKFNPYDWDDGYDYHGLYQLQVDVNGSQGPNILGRDLFYMELYSDGKVGDSYTGYDYDWAIEKCQEIGTYGSGCLTRIMNDGWKMDY